MGSGNDDDEALPQQRLTLRDVVAAGSSGRATFYGGSDGMSIHQGSCMFGNIDGNKGTGWDIAAISDKASDYAGSCGRCYEVACRPTHIRDGYGSSMDRTHSCNGQSSVIVTVTDTCPCYYPQTPTATSAGE
ncbi:hypothetical protein OEZ86_008697 [Tetradesmus obliquus]|nr:hypothetical protein OEZ86_008697 [Tetradesmus obliquus]